mgnify:CR=1 FL=1
MVSATILSEIQMSKRLLIFAGLLWATACASAAPNHYEKGMAAMAQANYIVAYSQMKMALAAEPDNPAIQKRTEEFRVLYNLDQARRLIQADKEVDGIENLRRLLSEYPDNKDAQRWLRKGILKLAKRVRFQGDEALTSGQLAQAQQYYAQVLLLVPGNEEATEGLAQVEARIQGRLEKADEMYHEALDKKAVLEWDHVLYLAKICRDYDPSRRDAVSLEKAASRRRANELRANAQALQNEGRWGAAAKTYRLAAGFAKDAGLEWAEGVQDTIHRLMDEMEASQLFERAELYIQAGRLDKADELIKKADPLCHHDRFRLTALLVQSRNARISQVVTRAKRFEMDHRYEEAIELYRQLLGGPSDTFAKDAITRIQEGLANVETLYQEAMKLLREGKTAEARKVLLDIRALNPRYKDVSKRLQDL